MKKILKAEFQMTNNPDSPQETTTTHKSNLLVIRETKCFYVCRWCYENGEDVNEYNKDVKVNKESMRVYGYGSTLKYSF